ncbi:hypothetical protein FAES_3051 [Fibrella aestuarina BUZ 2]|uniref:Uncharacterized protein n=1 Tax=Fibrella aestuarina BUZ 2 TaxID=1166018 RepID=I0KAA7_9BACT|nr:hypothetical protein [Fibrella aestuarina]CCH01060.1 hypothetical protein FAES_3051 [Fibrella aestuarina BUZ 2]
MQAAFPTSFSSETPSRATDWRLGIPTYAYAVVFSSFCIVMGLLWDIMWHMSIGRDGLFSAPHVVMYVGAVVAGLFSAYQILSITFRKNHPDRARSVNFWGVFYGSLGAMYCVWGALAMLTSAPFDDWWHNTYGLDVQILTPPHTILLVGMMMVQLGAIVAVLSLQNGANLTQSQPNDRQQARIRLLFVLSSAFMLSVLFVLVSENLGRYASHNSSYYINAAIIFPFMLLAIGRAATGGLGQGGFFRFPITLVAALYMLVIAVPSWILSLMPATPKLGPVANPITTYQAFMFPMLLVLPAFALDWLLNRFSAPQRTQKPLNDWLLAALTGAAFILVFLAVQWPFGGFLHESPYARNWFFMSDSWSYGSSPDWQYRYKFSPWFDQTAAQFAVGFAKALLIAMISARVGLWWGNWMRRVVR